MLVVAYSCCREGDGFFEERSIEGSHSTVDGGAEHGGFGGFGHCLCFCLCFVGGGGLEISTGLYHGVDYMK